MQAELEQAQSHLVFRATLGLTAIAIAVLALLSVAAGGFWSSASLVIASGVMGWSVAQISRRTPAETLTSRSNVELSASHSTELVKDALRNLQDPAALARSPLCHFVPPAAGDATARDLQALLLEVIGDLTMSRAPRDAEAGRLLLDYYVKKVGSHEIVMERLCMSRPTFYRRLHRGFELIASQLQSPAQPLNSVALGAVIQPKIRARMDGSVASTRRIELKPQESIRLD